MDDGILERAKLLSQAANQMASELSSQAQEYKAVVDARHKDQALSAAEDMHQKKLADKQRLPKGKDIGNQKEFRGAVISGSSLITTYADMRAFVPRGSVIVIDGLSCRLQNTNNAEWTANRMELLEDYKGPTNLDAVIQTTVTADVVRRRSPKKNKAAPVQSRDIMSAVSNLDPAAMLSGRDPIPNPRDYISQGSGMHSARSVGGKKSKKSAGGGGGLNTGRSEYDTLSSFQSTKRNSHHPLNLNRKTPTSSSSSLRRGESGMGSPMSYAGSVASSTAQSRASVQSTVPPRAECTHLEDEQYQMMLEIDSLTEEEKEQARLEMNMRMADRGQRKASERVEERKQKLNLPHTLVEDELYSGSLASSLHGGSLLSSPGGQVPGSMMLPEEQRGRDLTSDQLAERRRQARERYLQKQKEEDEIAEANFKAERELQEAIKKKMAEKAAKLQEITAVRVAKYKAEKREAARREKEAKEQALALKKEKDREAHSEEYIAKMHARMLETEKRLNRQKKEQQDMAHVQKLLQEEKLRELAAERQRTDNTLDYVGVGPTSTPSPNKKKLPPRPKPNKDSQMKLPRLDFSGKNSKHVRNLNSGRRVGPAALSAEETEENENENIVVTVGVQDSYHRKGQLNTARNSKSEQSSRAPAREARRNRRIQKQASDVGQRVLEQPAVEHVVQIGKPVQKPRSPVMRQAPAAAAGGASGGAVSHAGGAGAQSRFDAFDNDDDDFFNDDDGHLSDDSLTVGQQHQHQQQSSGRSRGEPSSNRSRIPVFKGAHHGHSKAHGDFDAATCVSALTMDESADQYSFGAQSKQQVGGEEGGQPAVKKKKKKKQHVWKMQPIEMRAYVPVPQETGSVEQR